MRINDNTFWQDGTKQLAQMIQVLLWEAMIDCEKFEAEIGTADSGAYMNALKANLEMIEQLRLRMIYYNEVAETEIAENN